MKILVTGGMGFIGKAVVNRLLKFDIEQLLILDNLIPKIHGLKPSVYDFKDKRVQFIKADISVRGDIEPFIRGVDIILHLAAETGTGESMYEIEQYNKVNISATALIFDILTNKKHNVKKIIVASSRAVYGEGKYLCNEHGIVYPNPRLPEDMEKKYFDVKCPICGMASRATATSEDSLLHPASFYGITKQMQESMVMVLSKNIGIAPVALRYQNVYGPGQSLSNPYTGILSIFSNRIRQGKSLDIFEDGQESRDFIYIDDVVDVTVKAIFLDQANGEIFNIGTGVPVTVLEVAQKIKTMLSSSIDIKISGRYRAGDIRHNYADIKKADELLSFKPKISFDDGLSLFIQWVNKQEMALDKYEEALTQMRDRGLYR